MRFVVLDEAGLNPEDSFTLVAGIVLHADSIIATESRIIEVLGGVPPDYQKDEQGRDFWFHATSIWNEKQYKSWVLADRLALLCNMMRIPRSMDMCVCLGMVRRGGVAVVPTFTPLQSDHLLAFFHCVTRADKWIREKTPGMEAATLIVEDTESMNHALGKIISGLHGRPMQFKPIPEIVQTTREEREAGHIKQEQEARISRIRQSVHFIKKRGDPLLQIADALAFGFRRYFEGQEHGDRFIDAILGYQPHREDFASRGSGASWGPMEVMPLVFDAPEERS